MATENFKLEKIRLWQLWAEGCDKMWNIVWLNWQNSIQNCSWSFLQSAPLVWSSCLTVPCELVARIWCLIKIKTSTWYNWIFSLPVCWIVNGYCRERLHVDHLSPLVGMLSNMQVLSFPCCCILRSEWRWNPKQMTHLALHCTLFAEVFFFRPFWTLHFFFFYCTLV